MTTDRNVTMKAAVYHRYGEPSVIDFRDVAMPVVGDREVLVQGPAAGVDPGVWFTLVGKPYIVRTASGLRRPRKPILGRAVAGRVKAVGSRVTEFEPGDEVYGEITGGAYAEYASAPASALAVKPANLTFVQAAAVPLSAVTALQGLRDKGRIQPGDSVLVNGASGGVGTFAVQLAEHFGADVTGVCSTRNVDLMRSIGANHVIDYTREDFTQNSRRYDLIFDLVGNHPLSAYRRVLTPKGTLVLSSGPPSPVLRRIMAALVLSPFVGQRMVPLLSMPRRRDLEVLTALIETGAVTPVIDRTYPLSEVAQALQHQGGGRRRGKVVITIDHDGSQGTRPDS
jgi:NADPH:quinone reductase-like Zn-dependent oxidoreductase